mgnify:CR=1 FL=1
MWCSFNHIPRHIPHSSHCTLKNYEYPSYYSLLSSNVTIIIECYEILKHRYSSIAMLVPIVTWGFMIIHLNACIYLYIGTHYSQETVTAQEISELLSISKFDLFNTLGESAPHVLSDMRKSVVGKYNLMYRNKKRRVSFLPSVQEVFGVEGNISTQLSPDSSTGTYYSCCSSQTCHSLLTKPQVRVR